MKYKNGTLLDLADLTTHGNPAEHPRFLVADHGCRVEVTQYPDAKGTS